MLITVFRDEIERIPKQLLTYDKKLGLHFMRIDGDGYCAAYLDGLCLIYDNRPQMCAVFKCDYDPQLALCRLTDKQKENKEMKGEV